MLRAIFRGKKRDWIFCLVTLLLCGALCFLPNPYAGDYAAIPRVQVEVLSVNNDGLEPLGIVNAGAQTCVVRVLEGEYKGLEVTANNLQNAALDKDKLFAPGDRALAMIQPTESGEFRVTMIDHYRLDTEGLLLFGGVSGCGALISLVLSVMLVWKVLIPLMLAGYAPIWMALLLVVALTAMIDLLVAGFTRKALVAMLGSLQGTALTCVLAVVFGNLLKLDGGSLPYVVPLIAQSTMSLDIRSLFFAMVFIANSGALMDLSMDIASASEELILHKPDITRRELLLSGFSVGRSVIGTMTTTLMLAYSGSYLSMLMYFAGQGTPLVDIANLKYVASEVLTTLVGSFGLVTVAPFTAITASLLYTRRRGVRACREAAQG